MLLAGFWFMSDKPRLNVQNIKQHQNVVNTHNLNLVS